MLLAIFSVTRYGPASLGPNDAAVVGDTVISMQEWQRAIDAANSSRRTPLDAAGEAEILDTLIDETLLLQLALDWGLAGEIPKVRSALVQTAMGSLATSQSAPATKAELHTFITAHPEFFRQPERRRVEVTRYDSEDAARTDTDGRQSALEDALLTPPQLARSVGRQLAEQAFLLRESGDTSAPWAIGEGWYRITLLERQAAFIPKPEAIEADRAQRIWERQAQEKALEEALTTLRREAGVKKRQAEKN